MKNEEETEEEKKKKQKQALEELVRLTEEMGLYEKEFDEEKK